MNVLYMQIGVVAVIGALYAAELVQRNKYRALVTRGLCARCQSPVSLSYVGYCASCFAVRRRRDRIFFSLFGIVVAAMIGTLFWLKNS